MPDDGLTPAPIEVQEHDASSPFGSIDHEPPADRPTDVDLEPREDLEPAPMLPGETPLAEMATDMMSLLCRWLDPEQPMSDLERTNLRQAAGAVERRYAPWLEDKADLILWSRLGASLGMVLVPRWRAYSERKKAEELAEEGDHSGGPIGVGQDLAPGQTPRSEDV